MHYSLLSYFLFRVSFFINRISRCKESIWFCIFNSCCSFSFFSCKSSFASSIPSSIKTPEATVAKISPIVVMTTAIKANLSPKVGLELFSWSSNKLLFNAIPSPLHSPDLFISYDFGPILVNKI
jgi:hypothetical protein